MAKAEVYQIGRMQAGGELEHAFNIRRTDEGGIKISKIERLTDAERRELFAHFGKSHMARTGGRDDQGGFWEGFAEVKPGTVEHFRKAVGNLPGRFKVMG
jgi:hypothetical protein